MEEWEEEFDSEEETGKTGVCERPKEFRIVKSTDWGMGSPGVASFSYEAELGTLWINYGDTESFEYARATAFYQGRGKLYEYMGEALSMDCRGTSIDLLIIHDAKKADELKKPNRAQYKKLVSLLSYKAANLPHYLHEQFSTCGFDSASILCAFEKCDRDLTKYAQERGINCHPFPSCLTTTTLLAFKGQNLLVTAGGSLRAFTLCEERAVCGETQAQQCQETVDQDDSNDSSSGKRRKVAAKGPKICIAKEGFRSSYVGENDLIVLTSHGLSEPFTRLVNSDPEAVRKIAGADVCTAAKHLVEVEPNLRFPAFACRRKREKSDLNVEFARPWCGICTFSKSEFRCGITLRRHA